MNTQWFFGGVQWGGEGETNPERFLTKKITCCPQVSVMCDFLPDDELINNIDNAKNRFNNDFLLGVWYRANEAIVESREKLLRLYTHYTVQQAEQVIEHVAKYRNLVRKPF